MPTYQYACTECGHDFETVQSFTDPALTDCPQCTGRLRKVFNSVGIVFKGSGFYRTDSREKAKAAANGDSADKGSDKGTDKKPAEPKADTGGSTSSSTSSTPSKAPAASGSSTAGSAA